MPIILEREKTRDQGFPHLMRGRFIDIGSGLGTFTFPSQTILRTHRDIQIPDSIPVKTFRDILAESYSLELPPKYVATAFGDHTKVRIGVTQDHMTIVWGMFLKAHGNEATILPLRENGKDVTYNMQPRPNGLGIPMIAGQEVIVEMVMRDKHTESLFKDDVPPSEQTTRPRRSANAWV